MRLYKVLQSDCLNSASNQFLFGRHFENEFSKSANAKQKSKALFTGLQKQRAKASYVTKPMNVSTRPTYNFPGLTYHQQEPFQGGPLQHHPRGSGQLFSRTFQRGGKTKSISIGSTKIFESSGFSECTSINKKVFSEERDSQYTYSKEI